MLTYRNLSLNAYSFWLSEMKIMLKNGSNIVCVCCKAIILAFCKCEKIIGKHILMKRRCLFQFLDFAMQVYGLLMSLLWTYDSNVQLRRSL